MAELEERGIIAEAGKLTIDVKKLNAYLTGKLAGDGKKVADAYAKIQAEIAIINQRNYSEKGLRAVIGSGGIEGMIARIIITAQANLQSTSNLQSIRDLPTAQQISVASTPVVSPVNSTAKGQESLSVVSGVGVIRKYQDTLKNI